MYALTGKAMQYMDKYTMSMGIPSSVLMENAAKGAVDIISEKFSDKSTKLLIVCGAGNNGGDGLALARWLMHLKYNVSVYFIGEIGKASEEFMRQLSILSKAYPELIIGGINGTADRNILSSSYDVIVDAIFGIGLNKRLGYNYVKFVEYLNSRDAYKIALDIPSGLNSTSGQEMDACFKADMTICFGNHKTGMFFDAGPKCCGEIELVDIGLVESGYRAIGDKLFICNDKYFDSTYEKALAPRLEQSHKGTYGTVGIIVSTNGMLGASMLSAKAAYRTGCGLVKIFCPSKYIGFFNVSIPEAVVVPYKSDDVVGAMSEFTKAVDVILIGPGLSEDSTGRLLVKQVLAGKVPTVFDAGAINIISKNLKALRKRSCPCVLTPHLGEMARLCNEDINIVAKNRIGFARKFTEKFSLSMLVKSDTTVISLINSKGAQKLLLNTVGNSGLATAGSGDVLAGVIASLIAQGNSLNNSLLYGTMIHGRAAEKFGDDADSKRKMMAGDIVNYLF